MHGEGRGIDEFAEIDAHLSRSGAHVVEGDGGPCSRYGGCGGAGEWRGEEALRLWARKLLAFGAVEGVAQFRAADVAEQDLGGGVFDDGEALEFRDVEDALDVFDP